MAGVKGYSKGNSKACRFKLVGIEPGDILFSTNPGSPESTVIRRATQSPFSHVAIYRGEFNFLEAADFGVQNFNHMRFGICSEQNVRLFRLHHDAGEPAAAALAAEKYRELDYWTPGAVMSAFKKAKHLLNLVGIGLPSREKGFFCSYFVSQCYRDAKVDLCPGLQPHETHPGNLLHSKRLKDITAETVAPLADYDVRVDAIDGEACVSPFQRFSTQQRHILSSIQDILANAGLPRAATMEEVIATVTLDEDRERQHRVDRKIAVELREQGYALLPFAWVAASEEAAAHKPGTINGTPFDQIPMTALLASMTVHQQLLTKWMHRLDDLGDEIKAGEELINKIKLDTIMEWQRYLYNRRAALEAAIANLRTDIQAVDAHARFRNQSGSL